MAIVFIAQNLKLEISVSHLRIEINSYVEVVLVELIVMWMQYKELRMDYHVSLLNL